MHQIVWALNYSGESSFTYRTEEAALDEKNPPSLLDDQRSCSRKFRVFKEIIGVGGKTKDFSIVDLMLWLGQEDGVNTIKPGPEEALILRK